MEKAESRYKKNSFEAVVSKEVEEIALRAAEMPEFREIVKKASSGIEALRNIREELKKHFPEISEIPEPTPGEAQRPIGGLASNESLIARAVSGLLKENLGTGEK